MLRRPFTLAVGLCLAPSLAAAQALQPVQMLHRFESSPANPAGALVQLNLQDFYGVTADAIYRVAPNGTTSIVARLTDGYGAEGAMVVGPDEALYGTTQYGGSGGAGTVFRFDPVTHEVRTLHAFEGANEGATPRGGPALAGGQLYVATIAGILQVDPASGATAVRHRFDASPPTSPLTAGPDGRLYGTTRGTIYRFDPAPGGGFTILHQFVDAATRHPHGRLHLGPDNRFYGASHGDFGSGGSVYRYDPAGTGITVLHTFTGEKPGPVVMTLSGSLYGSRNVHVPGTTDTYEGLGLFQLRPEGGGYVYDEVYTFAASTTGTSGNVELMRGADGMLYGYSSDGGPAGSGTVYRFVGQTSPLLLTVLHDFAPTTTWGPVGVAMGFGTFDLYGATSRGGSQRRGAFYQLVRDTGAVTFQGDMPGPPPASNGSVVNAVQPQGPNAPMFVAAASGADTRLLTALGDPAQVTVAAETAGAGRLQADWAPVRTIEGDVFFTHGLAVLRYSPGVEGFAVAGTAPNPGPYGEHYFTRPIISVADQQIYVGVSTSVEVGQLPIGYSTTVRVMRVNTATNQLVDVANLGNAFQLAGLAADDTGALYVAGTVAVGSEIRRVEANGTTTTVCAFPADRNIRLLSAAPNGRLVAVFQDSGAQRLAVCTPASNLAEVRALPSGIGAVSAPFTTVGAYLYGTTWDRWPAVHDGFPQARPEQPGGALIRIALDGNEPILDSDGDGLPSVFETTWGLDPFDASGDAGAAGDADGDGRTNAQELADGTHPRGFVTRYFAEGATGPFFHTRFDIANPNTAQAATVQLRYLTHLGERVVQSLVVPPGSHRAVDPAQLLLLSSSNFSTIVEADTTIAVDRTMSWDASGYGTHIETAVAAPATTWYFAEGSTSGVFSLYYLLQNPHPVPVNATVRYLRPGGLPPIERIYGLLPHSRLTIVVDAEGDELASTDLSAVITAQAPIGAERAMYFDHPGQVLAAGHASAGVTAPALDWFLAEGATGSFFDLFVLIANPNPTAAAAAVEYLLPGGGSLTKTYTVPANARQTIWVDEEHVPGTSGQPFANIVLSMAVRSTNGQPIVVERTMWWPGPTVAPDYWREAHNSPGATATATRWVVAGAELQGSGAAETYVLVANPGDVAGRAQLTILTDTGRVFGPEAALPAKSRTTVPFTLPVTYGVSGPFSILVESIGAVPAPIVVEHATYSSPGGVTWAAGGNALAAPLP